MHDCMSLGAVFAAPLVRRLPVDQQAMLIAIAATAVFSAACRTPLVAAVFVFILQNNAQLLPLLLLTSALAAAVGAAIGGPSWQEQEAQLLGLKPLAEEPHDSGTLRQTAAG